MKHKNNGKKLYKIINEPEKITQNLKKEYPYKNFGVGVRNVVDSISKIQLYLSSFSKKNLF
jgi:hypothetical protein